MPFSAKSEYPQGRIHLPAGTDINDTPVTFFTADQGAKISHILLSAATLSRKVYFYDGTGAAEVDGSLLTIQIPANSTVIVPGFDLASFTKGGTRRAMTLTSDTLALIDVTCTVFYFLP